MTNDFLPQIDLAKCIGCELCVKLCPNDTLALVHDVATVTAPEACDYAGICQEICPTEAISLTYVIVLTQKEKEADSCNHKEGLSTQYKRLTNSWSSSH
jgi:formate hydrogenlyase subunit 6/NADH:ubiquinone oxidoreductase subunit I